MAEYSATSASFGTTISVEICASGSGIDIWVEQPWVIGRKNKRSRIISLVIAQVVSIFYLVSLGCNAIVGVSAVLNPFS